MSIDQDVADPGHGDDGRNVATGTRQMKTGVHPVLGGAGRFRAPAPCGEEHPLGQLIDLRAPIRPDARRADRRWRWRLGRDDAGMATAEYAVVLLAAVGFAGLLIVILTSAEVRDMLTGLVRDALSV